MYKLNIWYFQYNCDSDRECIFMLPFQCIEFFFFKTEKAFPKLDFLLILQNTKEQENNLLLIRSFF